MIEPYDYELTYRCNDLVSTVKFSADIDLEELKERLRTFLMSATWTENQVSFLKNTEETILELEERIKELEKELDKHATEQLQITYA